MTARDTVTLRFVATPQDKDISGNAVAVGSIMEWIDRAGYVCAVGWSGSYCVTAYVGNVHFSRPVQPGELIEISAKIIHTGRTSMQVLVRLESADARDSDYTPAMNCILVFVAVDADGVPKAVPRWEPATCHDRALETNAQARVSVRQNIHAEMRRATFSDEGTTPRVVLRFLALPRVANFGGNVHGGTVMRWINEAAYACAIGVSSNRAGTLYTGGIHFYHPIKIGDLVEVDARLIYSTPEVMHISVHVRSKDLVAAGYPVLTTQCVTIFTERRSAEEPTTIRTLAIRSQEDHELERLARRLIDMRADLPRVPEGPETLGPPFLSASVKEKLS